MFLFSLTMQFYALTSSCSPYFSQLAIYAKSLIGRIHSSESSSKVLKPYEVKVAELSIENHELRAQVRDLQEKMERQASSLESSLAAKDKAEEREKKVRDELRTAKEELKLKSDAWASASQKAFDAQSSLKSLEKEHATLSAEYVTLSEVNAALYKELEELKAAGMKKDEAIM